MNAHEKTQLLNSRKTQQKFMSSLQRLRNSSEETNAGDAALGGFQDQDMVHHASFTPE